MEDFEKLIDAAQRGAVDDVAAVLAGRADLVNQRDASGATALHYAAFGGHRDVVRLLVERGADINSTDAQFGATPAGWAIEYLRELGGFLGIELDDFGYAIRRGDVDWAARFLKRFPALLAARDPHGNPFKVLAAESGNPEIRKLFERD